MELRKVSPRLVSLPEACLPALYCGDNGGMVPALPLGWSIRSMLKANNSKEEGINPSFQLPGTGARGGGVTVSSVSIVLRAVIIQTLMVSIF